MEFGVGSAAKVQMLNDAYVTQTKAKCTIIRKVWLGSHVLTVECRW